MLPPRRSERATASGLRIATKYHRLVREHLRAHGVADYQLVDSQGATEGHDPKPDGGSGGRHSPLPGKPCARTT